MTGNGRALEEAVTVTIDPWRIAGRDPLGTEWRRLWFFLLLTVIWGMSLNLLVLPFHSNDVGGVGE